MRTTRFVRVVPTAVAVVVAVVVAGCSSGTTTTTASSPTTSAPPPSAPATSPSSSPSGTSGLSGGGTTPDTGAAGSAPCTKAALLDGVAAQDPSITDITSYRCSGQWAYAQTANSTGAILLEANGPRWSAVPATAAVCEGTTIPSEIRAVACVAG